MAVAGTAGTDTEQGTRRRERWSQASTPETLVLQIFDTSAVSSQTTAHVCEFITISNRSIIKKRHSSTYTYERRRM
jgi:hypothetical protein